MIPKRTEYTCTAVLVLFVLISGVQATETYTFVTKWGFEGTGDGQFMTPVGIATDSGGYVYVADSENDRIQKFTSDGTYVSDWGSYGTGNGSFILPFGVATDTSGNVYVTDNNNHRVQKFNTDGTFVTRWGSYGTVNGSLRYPWGVAVDATGNVYIVDNSNNRIQKFTSDGTFVTKWGSFGTADSQFRYPAGSLLTHRATCMLLIPTTTASRSSVLTVPSSRNGERSVPETASSTTLAGLRSMQQVIFL